jgi:glycosyltransferase involved in cell wall biosynthesis
MSPKKVAIVHDWLTTYAGAEQVLAQMLTCFPQADVYSVVDFLPPKQRGFLAGRTVHTTFIQRLPGARKHYRHYLPLMPLAIEQLDLSGYDLILSSSHAVAKGVLVGPQQLHISYVHTPMRYAWDLQHQYLRESGLDRRWLGWPVRWLLHRLRLWDLRTAPGVDHFVANSAFIARRIRRVYGREATVIHPPVDIDAFTCGNGKGSYYLAVSRLVPYKRMDLIAQAFAAMPDKKLVIIGDGPDRAKLQQHLAPNITYLGYQPNEVVRRHMQQARAFVFAAEEDFGITPVEAQACGTPVIAYGRGGALESVRGPESPAPTGVFFAQQTVQDICQAVAQFEADLPHFTPQNCRANAERFSAQRFREQYSRYVQQHWEDWQADLARG